MRPIIGIVSRLDKNITGKNVYISYKDINDSIIKYGGIPIGIYPTDCLNKVIDICNGIICPGGDDITDFDLNIIDYCYKNDIPLFGICLGMQTMGYLFGGNLVDVKNHSNEYHDIVIKKDSLLYNIIGKDIVTVNSRHKSKIIDTSLNISAWNKDTIECIEDSNKKFFLGVEWHPESMINFDETSNKIFKYFINTCKEEKFENK